MVNGIILLIVAVLLIFAAKGAVRHFKGEGSCCEGGCDCEKEKKKKRDMKG